MLQTGGGATASGCQDWHHGENSMAPKCCGGDVWWLVGNCWVTAGATVAVGPGVGNKAGTILRALHAGSLKKIAETSHTMYIFWIFLDVQSDVTHDPWRRATHSLNRCVMDSGCFSLRPNCSNGFRVSSDVLGVRVAMKLFMDDWCHHYVQGGRRCKCGGLKASRVVIPD